jgi:glycosyltransferase involved in cell wall biosynthesis
MNGDSISISVIMPAYNEEMSIFDATRQNMETFSSLGLDYEIIIVDDRSTDKTGILGDELAQKHELIRCYHQERNLGPGGAFKTGIFHAEKDYVMFIPFDNPLSPEDLKPYLPRLDVCDIVVGVRVERVGYSYFGKFASFFYNRIMIPLLFNIGISDVNWIQVYRRNHFIDGTLSIGESKIFFLVEILIRAKQNKLIIAEIPSKMKRRVFGMPTCTRFSVMWSTFWDAIKFFWKIHRGSKP